MNKPDEFGGRFSVLIFCQNEERDLPGCLQSVSWADDVHVCDSGSVDGTVLIAKQHGAMAISRTYPNDLAFGGDEAGHKNWALANIEFKHQWVLLLDADERVTAELADEMSMAVLCDEYVAYRMPRRDYLFGSWLKHATPSPFNIRLVKRGAVRFFREINPVLEVEGQVGDLSSHFDHFPFSKGISHWFAKHNRYSSAEAIMVRGQSSGGDFNLRMALFARDPNLRRFHQKGIYYRLPLRPLIMFTALYLVKRGFLDGWAGLTYALLRAIYEYMIVLKVRELERPA